MPRKLQHNKLLRRSVGRAFTRETLILLVGDSIESSSRTGLIVVLRSLVRHEGHLRCLKVTLFGGNIMRSLLRTMSVLAIVVSPLPAGAVTFDWSYSGGPGVSGIGTLNATDNGSGGFTVNAIFGAANGFAITGLNNYAFPDQTISTTFPQVDFDGLAFTVSNGTAYEINFTFAATGSYTCGVTGYCLIGPGIPGSAGAGDPGVPILFSAAELAETPLPAALPLFAAGAGLLGFFGLQRSRRKSRRLAVAT